MSGTAINDDIEFKEIYGLDVIEIPTHKKSLEKIMKICSIIDKIKLLKIFLMTLKQH